MAACCYALKRRLQKAPENLESLKQDWFGPVEFVHGRLRVGEAMSPPLIRAVKSKINPEKMAVVDAPPGTSCPVINTVKGSDFILMVTEPTPFGLHDLAYRCGCCLRVWAFLSESS